MRWHYTTEYISIPLIMTAVKTTRSKPVASSNYDKTYFIEPIHDESHLCCFYDDACVCVCVRANFSEVEKVTISKEPTMIICVRACEKEREQQIELHWGQCESEARRGIRPESSLTSRPGNPLRQCHSPHPYPFILCRHSGIHCTLDPSPLI